MTKIFKYNALQKDQIKILMKILALSFQDIYYFPLHQSQSMIEINKLKKDYLPLEELDLRHGCTD